MLEQAEVLAHGKLHKASELPPVQWVGSESPPLRGRQLAWDKAIKDTASLNHDIIEGKLNKTSCK